MIRKTIFLLTICFTGWFTQEVYGQENLPNISVKNYNGRIVVSWKNNYQKPISNISIQRSFDSLRKFTTIGTVLNPQNIENGYADDNAPFDGMYYRLFISFEGGSYVFSHIHRPEKIVSATDSITGNAYGIRYFWQLEPGIPDTAFAAIKVSPRVESETNIIPVHPPNIPETEIITYPSKRIYTVKESSVVLMLDDAANHKYRVLFFDEMEHLVMTLDKLKDDYLILDKYNFAHSGWYHFEIYEDGKLIEKNKFFLGKDTKANVVIPTLTDQ